jgi:hypothetical protein
MNSQPNIEARYFRLLVLWFGISVSILVFLVFVEFTPVEVESNRKLSLLFNSFGIIPVGLSFLVKQRMLDQSIGQQNLDGVQSAYVLAFALCEMPALLGVVDHFLNNSSYYYFGFVVAIVGMLLHFPRKRHLSEASQSQF